MPSVAVIIVTYHSSNLIDGVLAALAHQTLQPERILVIDNGSADSVQTASVVMRHYGVEWLPNCANMGFAAANNYGIRLCQDTDYIALLNPDAYPTPDWLAALVSVAENAPNAASIASRLLCHEHPELLDGAGDRLLIDGKPRRRGHGMPANSLFLEKESVFCASAAAALYRTRSLLEVGGFDEDYFCYIEDVDLGFRLRLAGYDCLYSPQAVARHIGSATSGGQHGEFAVFHGHRNLVWNYVKNMPGVLFWLLMPFHLLLNLSAILYFILHGKGRLILRAKASAVAALPRIWRKRRVIQSRRVVSSYEIWRLLEKRILSY